jgi:hypothetical protein
VIVRDCLSIPDVSSRRVNNKLTRLPRRDCGSDGVSWPRDLAFFRISRTYVATSERSHPLRRLSTPKRSPNGRKPHSLGHDTQRNKMPPLACCTARCTYPPIIASFTKAQHSKAISKWTQTPSLPQSRRGRRVSLLSF